jgi:hypothetical protein
MTKLIESSGSFKIFKPIFIQYRYRPGEEGSLRAIGSPKIPDRDIIQDICFMVNKDPGRTEWFLFGLLALIWGSSFILMKEGMKSLTQVQVASLRIVSAGFAFLPMAPKVFSSVSGKSLPLIILTGLPGTFFPAYLFCMAETRLDSALAGILNVLNRFSPCLSVLPSSVCGLSS